MHKKKKRIFKKISSFLNAKNLKNGNYFFTKNRSSYSYPGGYLRERNSFLKSNRFKFFKILKLTPGFFSFYNKHFFQKKLVCLILYKFIIKLVYCNFYLNQKNKLNNFIFNKFDKYELLPLFKKKNYKFKY